MTAKAHDSLDTLTSPRALLIEDDLDFATALSDMLRSRLQFSEVKHVVSVEEAKFFLAAATVEFVFFDLFLQSEDRGREIASVAKLVPGAEIIVLTAYEQPESIFRALCAGAHSYLVKSDPSRRLHEALGAAIRKEQVFSPSVADRILQHFHILGRHERNAGFTKLTRQEERVLLLIRQGLTDKEIAQELGGISTKTAKNHVHAIRRKLGASNRTKVAMLSRFFPSWLYPT